ncbi:transient receptor potential channel pyrexia [Euwallacea fornicatus]|uniref:transient receptor potential channel pyrexia n=1 Tax=Euwallacea fornicatus TaxID=995702 RepID=UPI00338FDF81
MKGSEFSDLPFTYKDAKLQWVDVNVNIEDSFEITSEDGSASECGSEPQSRAIPVLQIWDPSVLKDDLQNLPQGEELKELIAKDAISAILFKNRETAFLLAAWMGKVNVLRILTNEGVPLDTRDKHGRTALHLASYTGHCDCVWLLLQNGAQTDVRDKQMAATPLHCAASMGHLGCLKLLIKHGADVNIGIEKRSPLHYAVQNLAVDCAKELLENNAIPNTPQVFSEAPLHVAAALGSVEAVKLLLHYGAAINVQSGEEKLTPLHFAAEQGYPACVQLLIEAGAFVNATNKKMQTPLHLAVLSQCLETSELLLQKGADPNAADCDGRTPLHCSTVNVQRSCECVRTLLRFGADPNLPDAYGYTPMHSAALNEFSNCVVLLIQNGGDVTARTKGGISALNFISKKTPEVIPVYISRFDNAIRLNAHDIGDVDCQLKMDFRILVPTMGSQETSLLTNFIEVGQKQVLEHPLCETFLLRKWRIIRVFFLFSLLYQTVFVLLFSSYIKGVYLQDCPSARKARPRLPISRLRNSTSNEGTLPSCLAEDVYVDLGFGLLVLNLLLMVKELFQILHSSRTYILEWENYLQWAIIISVFTCVQPMYGVNITKQLYSWQHVVAAVSILLAWVELLMIVARFPIFGVYVQMFTTVAINFFKFMLTYLCLIIGFTLCFGVIFANYPSFNQLLLVFFKVIIMMSGELEYEDVFFSDIFPIKYPYTAHIAYLVFVTLVTIVLSNLMVGLAVNDIQGLQKSAKLDRLVRQVRLMAHLENMLFSELLKWVPHKIKVILHSRALLLKTQRDYTLDIKPNDPRECKIPKNLIESAFEVAVNNKEVKSKSKSFKRNTYGHRSYHVKESLSKRDSKLEQIEDDFISDINKIIKQRFEKIKQDLAAKNMSK